jgi:hypothetical protein
MDVHTLRCSSILLKAKASSRAVLHFSSAYRNVSGRLAVSRGVALHQLLLDFIVLADAATEPSDGGTSGIS